MFAVPSLQHMAYSKIAVALCNQTDMKAPFNELKTFNIFVYPKEILDIILAIVERAKQKINDLRIPEMLKPDLIIVLKSTVLLINDWFIDHSDILEPDFDDVSSFYWRSECSIDTVKTAQALVRREDAPVTMRLKFASGGGCPEIEDNASHICIFLLSEGRCPEIAEKMSTWHALH
ncbi:hypothetical protein CDAR_251461 [Caerostris darwini]|uniref:Uncharacterized protein n=1 Tax=Caerostris darwini TaxID=1538125 RepID=A0AAV4SCZ7_9ARAC|nr:hypothetical protein CDAR_251461 [Caerostris darwini]